MHLCKFLTLFPRNKLVVIYDEFNHLLYKGNIWKLTSKYILSCLVSDFYFGDFGVLCIVVVS